jgi:hypothetical protein
MLCAYPCRGSLAYFRIFFPNLRRLGDRGGTKSCRGISELGLQKLTITRSMLQPFQVNFRPMFADGGHDIEGSAERPAAIFQCDQRLGALADCFQE